MAVQGGGGGQPPRARSTFTTPILFPSGEDANPLNRRLPAEVVTRRRREPIKKLEEVQNDDVQVDARTALALKPEARLKWLTKALKMTQEGRSPANDLYDIVASRKFASGVPSKICRKVRVLVHESLELFSDKQQRHFRSDDWVPNVEYDKAGADGLGYGDKADVDTMDRSPRKERSQEREPREREPREREPREREPREREPREREPREREAREREPRERERREREPREWELRERELREQEQRDRLNRARDPRAESRPTAEPSTKTEADANTGGTWQEADDRSARQRAQALDKARRESAEAKDKARREAKEIEARERQQEAEAEESRRRALENEADSSLMLLERLGQQRQQVVQKSRHRSRSGSRSKRDSSRRRRGRSVSRSISVAAPSRSRSRKKSRYGKKVDFEEALRRRMAERANEIDSARIPVVDPGHAKRYLSR